MTSFIWHEHYDEGIPVTLEPYPERTLLDYLSESSRQWPRRPALLFKGAELSYRRLDRLSDSFAAALVEQGVMPGDRVALCLPNCPQFVIAELGAWKAGAIVCPFNPTYSNREMEDALTATSAETVVARSSQFSRARRSSGSSQPTSRNISRSDFASPTRCSGKKRKVTGSSCAMTTLDSSGSSTGIAAHPARQCQLHSMMSRSF